MPEHSPEPWFVEPYCDSDRAEIHSGERTTEALEHPEGGDYVTSPVVLAYKVLPLKADAERIVACVNACRGLNLDNLPTPSASAIIEEVLGRLCEIKPTEETAFQMEFLQNKLKSWLLKPSEDPNPSPQ